MEENLAADGLPVRLDATYFEVHYGADLEKTKYKGQDLIFKIARAAPDQMPAEPLLLKTQIERVEDKVISTVTDAARKEAYIQELGALSRVGLENAQLNVANEELSLFRERFAQKEGIPMRAKYIRDMRRFGVRAGLSALILGIFLLIFKDMVKIENQHVENLRTLGSASMFIVLGICLGATLSAFVRNRSVNFENVGFFDTDGFDPSLRYTLLCIVAAIFSLLLYKGWLIVGITQQLVLNSFATDPGIALILGVVTGYSEPNVTRLVTGGLEAVRDWRAGSKS